jgi:hypothetical protein
MRLIGTVVDWSALAKVVGGSLVLGVGLAGTYALAILGTTRATEARRDGGSIAAFMFGVLAAIALAACAAVVVLGIVVMTTKK